MQGKEDCDELKGIIPRIVEEIFEKIDKTKDFIKYTLKVSVVEIYMERIQDLLDIKNNNLQIREDKKKGVFIEGLKEQLVSTKDEVMKYINIGINNRAVGATNMNEHSSRSHSLYIINLLQNNSRDLSTKSSKIYLVDLAGSEKISKTGASGLLLEEAKMINKSLTVLGMVINALTEGKSGHIPYRDSKLTRVLQESLGGNAKTCLIITCSPSAYNEAETLSTLRFGSRAKRIQNNAKVNKEFSVGELKQQVQKLEGEIDKYQKRMGKLQGFLKKNGIKLKDLNFSFLNESLFIETINEGDIESDNENENENGIDVNNNDNDGVIVIKKKKSSNDFDNNNNNQNNLALSQNKLNELNFQYIDLLNNVNELEQEKGDLLVKLNDAVNKLNDFDLEANEKDDLIEEFIANRINSETKIKELQMELDYYRNFINKDNLLYQTTEACIELQATPRNSVVIEEMNINEKCAPALPTEDGGISMTKRRPSPGSFEIITENSGLVIGGNTANILTNTSNPGIGSIINSKPIVTTFVNSITTTTKYSLISDNSSHIHNNTPNNSKEIHLAEEILQKLSEFKEKVPEINNLINTYKEKIHHGLHNINFLDELSTIKEFNNSKDFSENSDNNKNKNKYHNNSNENSNNNSSRKKSNIIEEIELKAEKILKAYLGEERYNAHLMKNQHSNNLNTSEHFDSNNKNNSLNPIDNNNDNSNNQNSNENPNANENNFQNYQLINFKTKFKNIKFKLKTSKVSAFNLEKS